jgi:hypothetical protein
MSVNEKLAVLVPVHNAGDYLHESIASCAHAGLDASQYELIVADNASTDGAPERLPAHDSAGAVVQLHHNPTNLGRVGNWNRSLEIAVAQGFRFVTFLFAGDKWLPASSLPSLFSLMRNYDALIGLSPFCIADENGLIQRTSQRFYTGDAPAALIDSRDFLSILLSSGLFPLGPLQANIYRISPANQLRFDEHLPTVSDVRATLRFMNRPQETTAVVSKPFLAWRERATRFHASMGTAQIVRDYFDTFHAACAETGIAVNHRRAKTRVLMNSARLIVTDNSVSQWPRLFLDLLNCCASSPYRSNPVYFLEALWLRFALRRHLLQVC